MRNKVAGGAPMTATKPLLWWKWWNSVGSISNDDDVWDNPNPTIYDKWGWYLLSNPTLETISDIN